LCGAAEGSKQDFASSPTDDMIARVALEAYTVADSALFKYDRPEHSSFQILKRAI